MPCRAGLTLQILVTNPQGHVNQLPLSSQGSVRNTGASAFARVGDGRMAIKSNLSASSQGFHSLPPLRPWKLSSYIALRRTHSTGSDRSCSKDLQYSHVWKSRINLFHQKVLRWLVTHLPRSNCLPQEFKLPHTSTCHVYASPSYHWDLLFSASYGVRLSNPGVWPIPSAHPLH